MIYLTGDMHGDRDRMNEMISSKRFSSDDYLIVLGDFGFIFKNTEDEMKYLDSIENCGFTILFVDGNHECFPAINRYKTEKRWGGIVHRIRNNIFHLTRGDVFELDGKSIFVMGGAYSIDKEYRREGYSWWSEELPDNSDYNAASLNLKRYDMKVDYILTHTMPEKLIYSIGQRPDRHDRELTGFFQWIYETVEFKHWYCGHWHIDKKLAENFTAMYKDVIELG